MQLDETAQEVSLGREGRGPRLEPRIPATFRHQEYGEETAKGSEEKQPKRKEEKRNTRVWCQEVKGDKEYSFPEGVTSLAKCKTLDRSDKTGVKSYRGVGNIGVIDKPDEGSFDGVVVKKKKKNNLLGVDLKENGRQRDRRRDFF